MKRLFPIAVTLLLGATACEAGSGERGSQFLGRPRILAIQAEPPSGEPGQNIVLSALAASPVKDDGVRIIWQFCEFATLDECAKADELTVIGEGATIPIQIPPDTFVGDSLVVWVDLIKGNYRERALKEVPVRGPGFAINNNPEIGNVYFDSALPIDGETITVEAGQIVGVQVDPVGTPNEIFNDSGYPTSEEVFLRTFTSGGGQLVDRSGTGASGALEYRAPYEPGTWGLWVIMEDGRGGVDWSEHWAIVVPPPEETQQ